MRRQRIRGAACAAAALLAWAGAGASGCDASGDAPVDTTWREAFDATETGWLLSTWGPSEDVVYAVGGAPDAGVVMRYDGAAWGEVDTGHDVPLLNWVTGFGADDVTIVGNGGTVLRWDGAAWALQATPTDQDLWGVWGASPDDLWAVGGRGRNDGDATILRYDGTAWSAVAVPALQKANVRAFYKVWGTDADNVYIVGQRGAVLRWDGAQLNEEQVGASGDLIAVWGTDRDHVLVVGGRGNGVVGAWDGASWRTVELAPMPGLNGVWARTPDAFHVVGEIGTVATLDFATLTPVRDDIETQHTLHAIHAPVGVDRVTTVGGSLQLPIPPYTGLAYTRELTDAE